ncbi:MAG: TonB-dependent siderophore receptor [Hydrogenophaga sp.]|uniref:TonB-dependent receptor n=1 Tax=Hydrogenophaga sp. TaxID=1904254 RepID=UPI002AB8E1C2|nr:TonB-dependent siderophore receptor [Hydrogenophaga sp.]MDZ4279200.1 TonB-dependent siderophore receptor [Hydrogenophaga sp.]
MPLADHAPHHRNLGQPRKPAAVMAGERFPVHAIGWAVSMAISGGALAQTAPVATQSLEEVRIIDFRGQQMDSLKYSRELKDTPRIISVLPSDLLEEQNVTSIKDALRNIPGISLQAGEGNPPGGDQLKIRGFNARDDLNVNGTRDLGNYFRDPFYIDQLEVVKGPNSAFSGRGSAGGTVNFVTKKPGLTPFNRAEVSVGTDSYFRATADLNRPIDDNSAVRINLMTHRSDKAGRDVADESRYGLYAAYTWGFKEKTQITADLLHTRQDDLPDAGLPLDRTNVLGNGGVLPPGLNFNNFYGHTDDYKKVTVNQLGLTVQHAYASGLVLRNQTRLSQVGNDSITSSPRIVNATTARGDTKPRDQDDQGFNNQTDLLFSFNTGGVRHDMVTGVELAKYSYENRRRRDTNGPTTSLYNPAQRPLGAATPVYDGSVYRFETQEVGLYVLNTMALSDQWELSLGGRWDRVDAKATRRGFTGANASANTTHEREDSEFSYSAGLVYKLQPDTSLYVAYGSAFNISGTFDRNQVQLAGGGVTEPIVGAGFSTPPEQVRAIEFGAKWDIGSNLDLNMAVFRTETSEGRFPAAVAGGVTIPNVEYHINGFEVLAAGNVTTRWKLYSGYTYLQSKVTSSPNNAYAVGQELGGTPRHSFNVFTTYDVNSQWTLGGGLQYVAEQTSGVQPAASGNLKITIPSYTVADIYVTYKFSPKTQLRLNLYNAFDKRYIQQLAEGGGQGIPGSGRQLIATVRHDF